MISIDEALELVLERAGAAGSRAGPAGRRGGPVAAEPARSAVDLPPFDRSAMDGYAVRAADTAPGVALRLVGGVAAGEVATVELEPGTARARSPPARRSRPAPTPSCSPSSPASGRHVAPERSLAPGTHIRRRGEDLGRAALAPAGSVLTLPRISALASAGVGEVAVHRRPRLHLIVTGSELLPLGAPPEPGRIHESNGLMVRLLAGRAGASGSTTAWSATTATPPQRRSRRVSRATCWSSPRVRRAARPRQAGLSRSAASTRCSGA